MSDAEPIERAMETLLGKLGLDGTQDTSLADQLRPIAKLIQKGGTIEDDDYEVNNISLPDEIREMIKEAHIEK